MMIGVRRAKTCKNCGKKFTKRKGQTDWHWGVQKFCTYTCSLDYYGKQRKKAWNDYKKKKK